MLSATDTTRNPLGVTSGSAFTPFVGQTVADNSAFGNTEIVTVTLSLPAYSSLSPSQMGYLSDPDGGGTYDTNTGVFTESASHTGDPTFATLLLRRLIYSAPSLADGQSVDIQAAVSVVSPGSLGSVGATETIDVNTAPLIAGTVPDEPIASGQSIPPFATVSVTDAAFDYSGPDVASITILDGGRPSDVDGLLTGPGLSKTGVGTYRLLAAPYYNVGYRLEQLKFATAAVAPGQTANPQFQLSITNNKTNLTSTDLMTSLWIPGPPGGPVPPTIAGTLAGQTVAPGHVLDPFASVTTSDNNSSPVTSAVITLTDQSGKASDATGSLTGTGLAETSAGSGVYTLQATSPKTLTSELDALTFHPTGLQTTNFTLAVSDPAFAMPAIDNATSVTETYNQPPWPRTHGTLGTLFNAQYYLNQNPDVAAAGVDPLTHYEQSGWKEGRDPSADFSTRAYLAAYPDVAAAGIDPLLHYLDYGQYEGRMEFLAAPRALGAQNPLMNNNFYFAQNADIRAAGIDPFQHYDTFGWKEGRNPDALFDTAYYLRMNPDVAAAGIDPLTHYENNGWKEGRNPSAEFSTNAYLAANADVKAAGMDPLIHYELSGASEGRATFSV